MTHHVIVLWFINEKHELLLAQRSHRKESDPGVWGPSVAGHIDPGETPLQATLRETQEELSIAPEDFAPTHVRDIDFDHPDGESRKFYVYAAKVRSDLIDKVKPAADEVAGVKWVRIEEVQRMMREEAGQLVPSANVVWPLLFTALEAM